ncbi:hypothetical protein H7U32_02505 [Bifidobacterium pullorum subsp. saeculare]|uniref:Uncharacterized protein n=1 Tax=Bifidobacterium pullorum subsp. saeculare TaxID=78257 RepID=A0A939B9V0_9BIFI|nr:hypothetical protein [Bifidobacterium pullorum]MBM6699216.1 hypothetical protein [Bifidobacterium pullorum subsp. saeculare]
MKDFLVYFPVGSDLSKLEASGYFDKGALGEAKKQKPVDTDRPFILMRDPKLYDTTEVPVTTDTTPSNEDHGWWEHTNPFVPNNNDGKNPLVPMKPAVSDATVYYLMEQNTGLDWSSLPDAKIDGAKPSKTSSNADAVLHEAMEQAAGDYMFSSGSGGWGTNLHVNADGTFSGKYQDTNLGDISAEHPHGTARQSEFTGQFSSAQRNEDGSYTLHCVANRLSVKGNNGGTRIENGMAITTTDPYGITLCDTFVLYPKGFDSAKMSESERGWAWWTSTSYNEGGPLQQTALSNMSMGDDGEPVKLTFFRKE